MARPSNRTLVAVLAIVIGVAGLLTGSITTAAGASAQVVSLRVLQMNLCDSGTASCYTGRSVAQATEVIQADQPDVVTLNEVCQADVVALDRALTVVFPSGYTTWAFQPADDRRTGNAWRCVNGQPYGIGLLVHRPSVLSGGPTYHGIYPIQDPGDPEERAWLCMAGTDFAACTTHLSSRDATVALGQCRYLLGTALPGVLAKGEPTVLGADMNLLLGGTPDVRSCVPPSYRRTGDGDVQYVLSTAGITFRSDRTIGMAGTTDHPGLLVTLSERLRA